MIVYYYQYHTFFYIVIVLNNSINSIKGSKKIYAKIEYFFHYLVKDHLLILD